MSIRFEDVSYRYAGAAANALTSIELTLEPGRILGLVGPNGAGKSTLCQCAVGLAPAVIGGELSGRVAVDELVTVTSPVHDVVQRAGILLQESYTQISSGAPSVWEEICFGPRNLSLPLDEAISRTWAAVDTFRLGDIVDRDPTRISGGQAQLVALASIFALGPQYLILDEPTSQLDPFGTRLVGETLASAARTTGVGVLIAEHKTDLLAELCDDIAVIVGGRIVASGDAAAVLSDTRLEGWGVAPPAQVAIARQAEAAGMATDPGWSR